MEVAAELRPEVLDDFYRITRKDIRAFLIRYSLFYNQDYNIITNFYQGKSNSISNLVFINFANLKKEVKEIFSLYKEFEFQLYLLQFVELLEMIEQINDVLMTLDNIAKWSRATTNNFGYNATTQMEYVMSQHDTLEKIANVIMNSNIPQDDWYKIAVDNNLKELDYTSEGGKVLQINLPNNSVKNFDITSVVDIIKGKAVFGRDINRFLSLDPQTQDLSCLNEDETIEQAINILIKLKKNDNPDFPNRGLQSALIVGQSKSLMNFPVIVRQLTENFENDDTLKNFTVEQIYIDQDNLFIDFSVQNRLNEVMEVTGQL